MRILPKGRREVDVAHLLFSGDCSGVASWTRAKKKEDENPLSPHNQIVCELLSEKSFRSKKKYPA
jgi:hypothetical protein